MRFILVCMGGSWGGESSAGGEECQAVRDYSRYSSVGFIPDEGFFQTLLLNSPFCHTVSA